LQAGQSPPSTGLQAGTQTFQFMRMQDAMGMQAANAAGDLQGQTQDFVIWQGGYIRSTFRRALRYPSYLPEDCSPSCSNTHRYFRRGQQVFSKRDNSSSLRFSGSCW
jgi:hypothetical protein